MGLLQYLKSLFLREEIQKHATHGQVPTTPSVEELDDVLIESIPAVTEAKAVIVTIGLDFGTSTTKCVVNLEGEDNKRDRFLAISFPYEYSKEGTLCVPTAIGVDNHTLLFGFDAETLTEDKIIRSFKMAIPCMEDKWSGYKAPFMLKDKPGYFNISGRELSALDLSVFYLAVIIKQIKSQIVTYIGENADIQEVYLNMAAPLDQLKRYYEVVEEASKEDRSKILLGNVVRDTKLSEYYMALGQWALRLSNQSQNPWAFEDALTSLKEIKEKGIIPFKESPAYVLPETVAAISAFVNRPRTRQGKFISFDVGAGTTDISVFWLQKKLGAPKPSYYASGSLHLGMDNIDLSLKDILPQANDCSLRQRREVLEETDGGLKEHEDRWKPILTKIEKHKDRVFGLAYDKEKICAHWGNRSHANVTLLMLGGGCQSSVMEKIPYLSLWVNCVGIPSVEVLQIDFTEKVILPDGTEGLLSDIPPLSKQTNLLVIAEGLAQRIIDICDYDITTEPILIRPRIPKESYLIGHWW